MSWDLSKYQDDAEFWMHYSIAGFRHEVAQAMDAVPEMNQKALAELLQVSEARVSNILHGSPNMTIKTLCQLAGALGKMIEIHLVERAALAPSPPVEPAVTEQVQIQLKQVFELPELGGPGAEGDPVYETSFPSDLVGNATNSMRPTLGLAA